MLFVIVVVVVVVVVASYVQKNKLAVNKGVF